MPRLAKLTAALTVAPYVCPPPPHVSAHDDIRRAIVHIVYLPAKFKRTSLTSKTAENDEEFVHIGCDGLVTKKKNAQEVVFGQRWTLKLFDHK